MVHAIEIILTFSFPLFRNDLINAEELTFVPKLIVLNIGTNKLHNLVEFGRSLVGLHRLKELKVFGNPICDKRDYRLRVLENTSIKYLDDVEIKPRLRTYLKEMQKRAKLEDIMETTTQDYMDRIAAERQIKSDNMDLLRRSELELEDAFSKYRNEMENELQGKEKNKTTTPHKQKQTKPYDKTQNSTFLLFF